MYIEEKGWADIDPIAVSTPNGHQIVDKIHFNGYEPTLHMIFSNGENTYEIDCTFNHSFRDINGEWVEAEYIEPHHMFDGGYYLKSSLVNSEEIPTFDITVPDENCYHLESGIVSHNTALLMGGVSEGINPDPAMSFTQMTAGGEMDRTNPTLLKLMKDKGVYTKAHVKEIKDASGSVQGVNWLTDEEKAVFKTAFEINQETVVRMASVRGNFIDQWQSLNLFFAADEDPAWISQVHKAAFTDPNILALYYIYTQAGVDAAKECEACS